MSKQAILCIDDENIVLDALKEQIQNEFQEKFMIETAEGGEEALEILGELEEDGYEIPIVIADFIMPGMQGDELLARIHELKPAVKKIMLTGQASLEGIGNAINKANLYRFLSKPWDKEDLILTIKEAYRSYEQDKTILVQNEELKELNAGLEEKVALRTAELRELNATKDKFFSIIAHDLKNPFNTLMGFSELLYDFFETYTPEKIKEYINIIFETSKNSYALLENLLEWSRAQTGRIKNEPRSLRMHGLVQENIELLQNQAIKKKIILGNNVVKDSSAFVDENMLRTVIRNLLSNAIKYTREGGSVAVSSNVENNNLTLHVSDTGVGINEENQKKLFKIDSAISTEGTAEETGTGLGLILCKEFMVKNKGSISVTSIEGKGSTFSISMPISKT